MNCLRGYAEGKQYVALQLSVLVVIEEEVSSDNYNICVFQVRMNHAKALLVN